MRYSILSNGKFYAMSETRYSEYLRTAAEHGPDKANAFAADCAAQQGSGIKEHEGEFCDLRKLSQKAAHEVLAQAAREAEQSKADKAKARAEAQIKALQEKLAALQAQEG